MKRAPVVYRAATGTQGASHGFSTIEIAATFQRVHVGIVIWGAVYEDLAAIRSGDKLHAAVFHAPVLRGHPDTKFPIGGIWVRALSLVLVPRRGRTATSGLKYGVLKERGGLLAQQLFGNRKGVCAKQRVS